jgi:hypothetical protein
MLLLSARLFHDPMGRQDHRHPRLSALPGLFVLENPRFRLRSAAHGCRHSPLRPRWDHDFPACAVPPHTEPAFLASGICRYVLGFSRRDVRPSRTRAPAELGHQHHRDPQLGHSSMGRLEPRPQYWFCPGAAADRDPRRLPLYAAPRLGGLFLSYLGIVLHSCSSVSVALFSLAIFWLVIKSFVEEGFLRADPQYAAYLQRVRWRRVPGIV